MEMVENYKFTHRYQVVCETGTLDPVKINNSEGMYRYLSEMYESLEPGVEHFSILGLNNAMEIVMCKTLFQGGISSTVVDIRVVAKHLLDSYCVSCVVAHNHPSGNLKASSEDIRITKDLFAGLKTLNIRLLDHIILGNGYYSFADDGLIPC